MASWWAGMAGVATSRVWCSILLGAGLSTRTASIGVAQDAVVPIEVCAQSPTWTRPSPAAQAKIWNDPRYRALGAGAYEWTHDFATSEPDSASISYHARNLSGLWTAVDENHC